MGGRFKDRNYALGVIKECRDAWERLIRGDYDATGLSLANLTVAGSPFRITDQSKMPEIPESAGLPPEFIDKAVDKWFFL